MQRCPPEIVMLGHRLADAVRPITTKYFRDADNGLTYKDDKSPVTLADKQAEQAIRDILMQERPDDGIVGEEFPDHNAQADFQWIIDPIDGTKAFSAGLPTFGTLIGLMYKGEYIFGLCDQTLTRDRWTGAKGHPTLWNGHRVTTRTPDPDNLVIATTDPMRFEGTDQWDRLKSLYKNASFMACGGMCLSYCMLASGKIDLIIETGQYIYDIAPLVPIVEGAGGKILMADGTAYRPNDTGAIIAVGDKALIDLF